MTCEVLVAEDFNGFQSRGCAAPHPAALQLQEIKTASGQFKTTINMLFKNRCRNNMKKINLLELIFIWKKVAKY